MCTAFKSSSIDICNALVLLAQRLCTQFVAPKGLSSFTAFRLIDLDKCPGVRTIGVAEVARRIVSKAILTVIGGDAQQVAGTIQLCAGQEAGSEASIHAVLHNFNEDHAEGVLLIDPSNAFNRLNREVALRDVQLLCPSITTVLKINFHDNAQLFVDGETLFSREGPTQGDPLSMPFYALATIPIIKSCKSEELSGEVWFADDATGFGSLHVLRRRCMGQSHDIWSRIWLPPH